MPGRGGGVSCGLQPSGTDSGGRGADDAPAEQFSSEATAFALSHEADAIGIAPMDPLYVFEGYTIDDPWVIVLALAHNYERLKQVPSDETNGVGVTDIGDQYARGTRASYALANWIRSQGYHASAFPGPMADALLLIPPAIASGLGELGKHGSLISRHFGSGVRLAGVTTDMPLVATAPDRFGADEFCMTCQICTRECPPDAIAEDKQMVRGVERWYVDFDKCIPYFAESASCGICIAVCPGHGRTCVRSCSPRWPGACQPVFRATMIPNPFALLSEPAGTTRVRTVPHIALPEGFPGITGGFAFRPETARPMRELAETLLRGPSTLTSGEREMIATFVSHRNECDFCQRSHRAAAAHHLDGNYELVDAVKRDTEGAPVSSKLKALLAIAGKVQQDGKLVTAADVDRARGAGATDIEIHDAVLIAAAFSMFNRYVDGLATFTPTDPAAYDADGPADGERGLRPSNG